MPFSLNNSYGDMSAHNMLISEGQKSAANVMARLAVVPMVQVIEQKMLF